MENWFDIVEPHKDIKEGDFDRSVFAAKLDEVVYGTAPLDYSDPHMFFKKTYFTKGITSLLHNVYRKLDSGRGNAVVEVQTPFGGGKTHALISIYHYINSGKEADPLLPEGLERIDANLGVVVGTALNPVEGRKVEELEISTLWGDIAYQLGGKEGYRVFEKNDRDRISPGKRKLKEFLEGQQPFILLFDEILEYVVRAAGVHYKETNLATQTYAFLQELTETVSSLDKGMMIVTLPSSEIEDPSEKSGEALERLGHVIGRIEKIETPVKDEEVYSVISRRLFDKTRDKGKKDSIIHEYIELYQRNKSELPVKARDPNLKRKMELSYPFHPDVIDILNEKWGSYPSFQRTRGALRLLANVIEDLYDREKNIDIILPSDINLENPSIRREFLRHIGSEYESVIASDITEKALGMDKENKNWKHLAERICTAIFFHSFTAKGPDEGIDISYIKLATLRHDTIPSMVTEVLHKLATNLWYLNEKNGRHYFSKIPNINRMVLEKKEFFRDSYKDELRDIIKAEAGRALSTYIWPNSSEEIPDNQDLKLVIHHPNFKEGDVDSWIDKKGKNFREYKNTLIFAFSDPSAFASLREEIKTYLALKDIKGEIEEGKNEPLKEKLPEIKERMKKIQKDFSYNLRRTYHSLQVGSEIIDLGQPSVGKETLSGWYKNELEYKEKLVNFLHYRLINDRFLKGQRISTKQMLDQFYKDKNLFMLSSPEVLKNAIRQGVAEGAFCLGAVREGEIDKDSFKFKSSISTGEISFYDDEYLIPKDECLEFKEDLEGMEEEKKKEEEAEKEESTYRTGRKKREQIIEPPQKYRSVFLEIEGISSTKIADLNRGVLMPIGQEIGDFDLKITINLSDDEGIPKSTIEDKIKEAIRQLGGKVVDEDLK